MADNLARLRTRLLQYLELRHVSVSDGATACPGPKHLDPEALAQVSEAGLTCPACATTWDVFDVAGLLDGIPNTRSTFAKRVATVKDVLALAPTRAIADLDADELEAARVAAIADGRHRYDSANAPALGNIPFRILGMADADTAWFIGRGGDAMAFDLAALSKTKLQQLAPMPWWIQQFEGAKGRLDIDNAIDFVVDASRACRFDSGSLRGRGAWREPDGRLCFHDGEHTYGDPEPSRIYQRKAPLGLGLDGEHAAPETRAAMLAAAAALSFETQADCARLLAWSAIAPFCGALPWRPAGFLTGVSKSGKSTILHYVVTRLCRPLFVSGDSTSAYIRQATGNDTQAVVIDEAESASEGEHRRMVDVFALMRQSTSDDAPVIGKGSVNGKPLTFTTRNMYLFSAIAPGFERQADANRMFVVDLKRPENDWHAVKEGIVAAFTEANCAGVRAYTWSHLRQIIDGAETVADAITDADAMDTRSALLEGILWSTFWRVWKDEWPEPDRLRAWLGQVYATKALEPAEDDADAILRRLLDEQVPLHGAASERYSLRYVLQQLQHDNSNNGADDSKYRTTALGWGLYVYSTGDVGIPIRRAAIARVVGQTQYHLVIRRHGLCSDRSRVVSAQGWGSWRCVIFSAGVVEGEPGI